MEKSTFVQAINKSYTFKNPSIYLGAGVFEGEILADAKVNLPLRMMTRHGLVTGATGSGKTRTLQLIAEQLSAAGVPCSCRTSRATFPASRKRRRQIRK
ncbi:MAG TPA: helicase HerA-like domain-containing protein [Chryseosolibacter sp.]